MPDGPGGFFLFLFESFAARAMLGSLAAAVIVGFLLRREVVRAPSGRRLLMLTPLLSAAVIALASHDRGFLPKAGRFDSGTASTAGELLDVLGEVRLVGGTFDVFLTLYVVVVAVLVGRRLLGSWSLARLRRFSAPAPMALRRRSLRLALHLGVAPPDLRMVSNCPGGAFTAGTRRPWIALDGAFAERLDEAELDALLAHELAHIRRRDTLFCLITGLVRDLTFFLPAVHMALRWLRREQEETADDLASRSTRRPGALASSILKAWEVNAGHGTLVPACPAVGSLAPTRVVVRRLVAEGFDRFRSRGRSRDDAPHVLVRVQRLVAHPNAPLHLPGRTDVGLPISVVALAVAMALAVPAWFTERLNDDGLLVRVFSAPAQEEVESPALATFRAVTSSEGTEVSASEPVGGNPRESAIGGQQQPPDAVSVGGAAPAIPADLERVERLQAVPTAVVEAQPEPTMTGGSGAVNVGICPCVETPAQLRARESAAAGTGSALVWTDGRDAWELQDWHSQTRYNVNRELLSWQGGDQQVNFFTVSRSNATP